MTTYRNTYTPEEKKQYRKKQMDDIQAKLKQGVEQFISSDRYAQFLTLMTKFHDYSFNNCILICMQKPNATLVAGYNNWLHNFHRVVKKGERGIRILYPMTYKEKDPDTGEETSHTYFRPTCVFDVSQTHPVEDMEPVDLQLIHPLTGDVTHYGALLDAVLHVSPVPLFFENIPEEGTNGYFNVTDNKIVLQKDLSQLQMIKTGIHEITHATLHNSKDIQKLPFKPDNSDMEIQAESTEFMVTSMLGLDTQDYSFPYVGAYCGKDLHKLTASMPIIRKTADDLYNSIYEVYKANTGRKDISE